MASLFLAASAFATLFGSVHGQSFPQPSCTRLANPPAASGEAAVCGQRGRVTNAYEPTMSQTADNVQQCQNLCLRRQYLQIFSNADHSCEWFTYNPSTKLCTFSWFGKTFQTDASSPTTLTDARCFDCSVCPSTIGQDLLDLSTFEGFGPLFAPFASGGDISTSIVHPGYNSNSSLYTTCDINKKGCPSGWAITQVFNGCKGPLYSATFDYKVVYASGVVPQLTINNGDVRVTLHQPQLPNNTWMHFVDYFHASGTPNVPVRNPEALSLSILDFQYTRKHLGAYFDNVNVHTIQKDLTPPSTSPELIQNNGFESGQLAPWNFSYYNPSGPYNGIQGVQKPGINSNYAWYAIRGGYTNVHLVQQLPVLVAGAEYVFSFDYRTLKVTTFIVQITEDLQFTMNACTIRDPCNGTATWPIVARTQPGAPRPTLNIGANWGDVNDPSNNTLILDNVSLRRL